MLLRCALSPVMKSLVDKLRTGAVEPLDVSRIQADMLAGVAVILRSGKGVATGEVADCEALFIRRSSREDDPWSGHMAFPGGRFDPREHSLKMTAIRETREEIGLDLRRLGTYLGVLPPVIPHASKPPHSALIEPHCFLVCGDPTLRIDEREVAEAIWLSLAPMMRGETQVTTRYSLDGQVRLFPGFETPLEQPIWGLTYRILKSLFGVLDANVRHSSDASPS